MTDVIPVLINAVRDIQLKYDKALEKSLEDMRLKYEDTQKAFLEMEQKYDKSLLEHSLQVRALTAKLETGH